MVEEGLAGTARGNGGAGGELRLQRTSLSKVPKLRSGRLAGYRAREPNFGFEGGAPNLRPKSATPTKSRCVSFLTSASKANGPGLIASRTRAVAGPPPYISFQ
jgi:hypothetical protein